jgi:3-hydroxypropanoate dehydrogenase
MPHIDQNAQDQLFYHARTANGFLAKPVSNELLEQVYNLARMAPTSMNTQPTRYVFLNSPASRERLIPTLMGSNVDKTRQAPVTVIVATDTQFYLNMPTIWHDPTTQQFFENAPLTAQATASRNGTLGAAYFIMAARALGLDCGPMSGLDLAKVNAEFFPDGRLQTNFAINLGYADHNKEFARNRRLDFSEACQVL